jgi:hypothetical protein
MMLAKDHDVIEAVPPDRSDQPLRKSCQRDRAEIGRGGKWWIELGTYQTLRAAKHVSGVFPVKPLGLTLRRQAIPGPVRPSHPGAPFFRMVERGLAIPLPSFYAHPNLLEK